MNTENVAALCIAACILGIFGLFTGCTVNEHMEQTARVKAACADASSHACSTAIARTSLSGP